MNYTWPKNISARFTHAELFHLPKKTKVALHQLSRLLHGAVRRALQPEISAALYGAVEIRIEAAEGFIAGGFGPCRVGCAVDETVESLMIGPVAVILNYARWFLQQKNDPGRIREFFGLFQRQMAVAHHGPIL